MAYYRLQGRGEVAEREIVRLMDAAKEDYIRGRVLAQDSEDKIRAIGEHLMRSALGNFDSALKRLSSLAEEYVEVASILKEESEKVLDPGKKKILEDAIFVLKSTSEKFKELNDQIMKKGLRRALAEEILISQAEFEEVNKALMELIEMRWWVW